jgi:hypothetical protein
MHGGYNFAYDKIAMPNKFQMKCHVTFYSTKSNGCTCCNLHQMLGLDDDPDGCCHGKR